MAAIAITPELLAMQRALFAPHLFGILGATLLTGAFFSEVSTFFGHTDPAVPKRRVDVWVVRVLFFLSLLFIGLDCWCIYDITVTHAGDITYPDNFHLVEFIEPFVAALTGGVSQLWFAERAWRLVGKSRWFLAVVSCLLLASVAAGMADLIVCVVSYGSASSWLTEIKITGFWLFSSMVVDIIITGVLIWKVRELLATAGNTSSRSRSFSHIVRLSFATGALTALTAAVAIATYFSVWATSNAWLVPGLWLPRLSALSCVLTINMRARWRSQPGQVVNVLDLGVASTLYSPREDEEMREYQPKFVGREVLATAPNGIVASSLAKGKEVLLEDELGCQPTLLYKSGSAEKLERDIVVYKHEAPGLSPTLESKEYDFRDPERRCSGIRVSEIITVTVSR